MRRAAMMSTVPEKKKPRKTQKPEVSKTSPESTPDEATVADGGPIQGPIEGDKNNTGTSPLLYTASRVHVLTYNVKEMTTEVTEQSEAVRLRSDCDVVGKSTTSLSY